LPCCSAAAIAATDHDCTIHHDFCRLMGNNSPAPLNSTIPCWQLPDIAANPSHVSRSADFRSSRNCRCPPLYCYSPLREHKGESWRSPEQVHSLGCRRLLWPSDKLSWSQVGLTPPNVAAGWTGCWPWQEHQRGTNMGGAFSDEIRKLESYYTTLEFSPPVTSSFVADHAQR
jgi:hypothetical protein